MVFDIKMDFTHKARLVAGGHVTDPPSSITYSSVVSRESVRIAFVIAALNDLEIMAADIGNAYLNAYTSEKVFTITGPEFGDESNRVAILVRALYGLKSSGAAWHACFAQSLFDLGFVSCQSDPDIWRRGATKKDGLKYFEYVLVYVDDLLVISEEPDGILEPLSEEYKYRLKDVGTPTCFLGAKIGKKSVDGT
jgi:Reverse transcriptase (RNA-dependent DNA polymerase)